MTRKIIQIISIPDTETFRGCVTALCDDGTLWYMEDGKWNLINIPIPQEEILV